MLMDAYSIKIKKIGIQEMLTVCSRVKFFLQKLSANFVILLPEVLTTF
jgi:hypothetical protein